MKCRRRRNDTNKGYHPSKALLMVVSMSLSISVVSASFQFSSGGVQMSVHRDHRGTRGGVGMRNMPFLYLSQDSGTNTNEGGGGGLMLSTLSKSSLVESAFAALSDEDQYDAVLTGLCAKLLDNPLEGDNDTPLEDPIQLLQEMNARNIIASPRSTMALIDVAVKVEDPRVMAAILSAAIANGAVRRYGSLQSDISPVPLNVKQKQDRLQKLADVPTDNRAKEVASALSTSGLLGVCFLWNAAESILGINNNGEQLLGSDDYSWITALVSSTSYSSIVIGTVVTVFVVDNCFDVLRTGSQFLLESKAMPDSVRDKEWSSLLPSKDAMPLGLGSGQITGTVVAGLGRLINVDTERECECEAAALFCAYSLGLPCFAFRPNALEAAVLMVESVQPPSAQDGKFASALDPLWSSMGLLKVLIWLMAPVAMESSKHAQLQASDPREGGGFLQRLEQKSQLLLDATGNDNVISDLLRSDNPESQQEAQDLIKWAYAEADLMLRNNKPTITALTERLIGGAATVGDCIAVIEEW